VPEPFVWDEASRRFRGADGKFLGKATMQAIRDDAVDKSVERVTDLAGQLTRGEIEIDAWRTAMRAEVKQVHIIEYLVGRGGRSQMTPRDWGRIGAEVRKQYAYVERLIIERTAGTVSDAAFTARARMYPASATASHERANGARWNITLPAQPGDGGTQCLSWCRCSWDIRERNGAIEATWTLGGSRETCPDCQRRAQEWAPLRFDVATGQQMEAAA
jgi:hypothetical protein